MKKKTVGCSIFGNIYMGTADTDKQMWVGQKTDVTNEAIAAVFEWFMCKIEGNSEYSITYPGAKYELVMRLKKEVEEE